MIAWPMLSRARIHGVLWNSTNHVEQVARLRLEDRVVRIDALAEFAGGSDESVATWLREYFPERGSHLLPGYCGFHPGQRLCWSDRINPRRLVEPGLLGDVLAQHAGLPSAADWLVRVLDPLSGAELVPAAPAGTALFLALPVPPVRALQARLCQLGIRPERLEIGSLALVGALARHLREFPRPDAIVACELERTQTHVYFVTKNGVHAPVSLPVGLMAIAETAARELKLPDGEAALPTLAQPTDALRARSRQLVRPLTHHLKAALGKFEMETGEPVGAFFGGHLPAKLAWLEDTLGESVELESLLPDLASWLPLVGVQLDAAEPALPRGWFQALSLLSQLAAPSAHHAPGA